MAYLPSFHLALSPVETLLLSAHALGVNCLQRAVAQVQQARDLCLGQVRERTHSRSELPQHRKWLHQCHFLCKKHRPHSDPNNRCSNMSNKTRALRWCFAQLFQSRAPKLEYLCLPCKQLCLQRWSADQYYER